MASAAQKQSDVLDLFAGIGYSPRPVNQGDLEFQNVTLREVLGPRAISDSFNFFNSEDLNEAKKFYTILLSAGTHEKFMELARDARRVMNKRMFAFGVSWAMQDSPIYVGIYPPPIAEHSPEYFIPYETIVEAVYRFTETNESLVIPIHPTGSPENEENKVAYFREDIGVNSHHWHWHLVYPYNGKSKDRKGELFYYMHQQMVARYDAERLSVGLKRVVPFLAYNLNDELVGYSSHLSLDHGKRSATRPDGLHLKRTTDLVRWRERIMEAIHSGYLLTKGGKFRPLYNESGTDLLGAVLEASDDSVNKRLYGNFHNMLHNEISEVHDITGKFEELPGAIGDVSTAVRDPLFFRLHKLVDNIFTELKNQLEPYTTQELSFEDVEVTNVTVEGSEENLITTSMKKGKLPLNYAIHIFPPEKPVEVEYEYLDHDPFSYKITVNNNSSEEKDATVRIFMAPKFDEVGKNLKLGGRRRHFIELDKFKWSLKAGENNITRQCTDSAVTITSQSIPTVEKLRTKLADATLDSTRNPDDYCSCGWPHHLLVPRGTYRGMVFRLFVILTDYNEDCVGLSDTVCIEPQGGNPDDQPLCKGSMSYCGVKDAKYPDKQAMGFPFDRPLAPPPKQCRETEKEDCVEDAFKTSNMFFSDITIRFQGSA